MKLCFYCCALWLVWGLSIWCSIPMRANDIVIGNMNLGTKVLLQIFRLNVNVGNESERDSMPRTPAYIPILLSLSGHTLYAYPENVNGSLMTVTVLDADEANVATYTVTGKDIVALNLPSELSGDYTVQVEVGETVYMGTLTLD